MELNSASESVIEHFWPVKESSLLSLMLIIPLSFSFLLRLNPVDFSAPWSKLLASSCSQSMCEYAPSLHLQGILEGKSMRLTCHLLQSPTRQASYSWAVNWSSQSHGSSSIQTHTPGQLEDMWNTTMMWCHQSPWVYELKCIHYLGILLIIYLWQLGKASVGL